MTKKFPEIIFRMLIVGMASLTTLLQAAETPEKSRQFLFETAPFPACHAATICELGEKMLCAFFAGTDEGEDDVGIWLCTLEGQTWGPPVRVAEGRQPTSRQLPCWNPVLWPISETHVLLFYKVGPSPQSWWGVVKESHDAGRTWSAPRNLPEGILGPVRNKPVLIDHRLWCGSSTEHDGWRVHMEWTADQGRSWERTPPLNSSSEWGLIQPTLFTHPGNRLQILCRSQQGRVVELWSNDLGETWSAPQRLDLPNPNSGIDGVTLADGRHLLVYNHTDRGRSPLNVALSTDGRSWSNQFTLENEPGEFSYPAVIQSRGGSIEIVYTWNRRRIRHVTLDPAQLKP
ncbi:MAG TPA: sialidase [Planctomycetaceae bacterium]|nr:sialidase [Planctomycetaceae bacterium]